MTLPSSGTLQASDINVELGRAWNHFFDVNGAAERNLAGKPSGAISFADFYGKSNIIREPPTGEYYGDYGWFYESFYRVYDLYWQGAPILTAQSGTPPASRVVGSWTYYRGSHQGGEYYAVYRVGRY